MAGVGVNVSHQETDTSSLVSGNGGGDSSADRISKQFINIGGGNNLDLNSYLNNVNAGFYASIRGEQNLELGLAEINAPAKPGEMTYKYAALGAGVLVAVLVMVSLKGRR